MFDEQYYSDIWPNYYNENGEMVSGLHRHDYCESLANALIAKYGKCSILDIGTACGYLVKTLRDKGCDAWGMEVSDYAIENSCAKGFVVKGDVRDIPFKDNRFHLVISQGLWEYVPEDEVDRAFAECKRVGKYQWHNFDAVEQENFPEHKKITIKPRAWWNEKKIGVDFVVHVPKVLVACATHQVKEYCFQEWIDNVKTLNFPDYDILVVDNSPDDSYAKKYENQVRIIHIETDQAPDQWLNRICASMAEIRKHFLAGPYDYWMNIESDNIPPKNVISTMLKHGQGADWVEHCYFVNGVAGELEQGIGCGLLSRKLIQDFDMDDKSLFNDSPDSELWNWVKPRLGTYKAVELWGIMDVKHRK